MKHEETICLSMEGFIVAFIISFATLNPYLLHILSVRVCDVARTGQMRNALKNSGRKTWRKEATRKTKA